MVRGSHRPVKPESGGEAAGVVILRMALIPETGLMRRGRSHRRPRGALAPSPHRCLLMRPSRSPRLESAAADCLTCRAPFPLRSIPILVYDGHHISKRKLHPAPVMGTQPVGVRWFRRVGRTRVSEACLLGSEGRSVAAVCAGVTGQPSAWERTPMLGRVAFPSDLPALIAPTGGLWIRRVLVRAQEGQLEARWLRRSHRALPT
jgi:hypothetical protein